MIALCYGWCCLSVFAAEKTLRMYGVGSAGTKAKEHAGGRVGGGGNLVVSCGDMKGGGGNVGGVLAGGFGESSRRPFA